MNAPRLILGLRDLIEHVVEGLHNMLADTSDIRAQLTRMEKNMATKAELETALANLQTAVSDRIGEATASVEAARGQLTTMQATLDRFVSEDATEDAAFQATITDLQQQLAEASSGLDDAVASINALTASVQGGASTETPAQPSA